jgi:alpha-amylase
MEIETEMKTSRKNRQIENRQLVLCFQVHQPNRLRELNSPGESDQQLFDDDLDREIMQRISKTCYLPTNNLLMRLIEQYPEIRIAFSISGVALEQMERYAPETIESFKRLAETGAVEFIAETYYHSLAFLLESDEFEIQILEHAEKLIEHFGVHTSVFRNAHLIYNDDIGRRLAMMGFHGVLTEGCDRALRHNRPHTLYEHRDMNGLKLFFRNTRLSDDIAFRAPNPEWNLTADQYALWLDTMPDNERLVTVCLDYETFGEHHKPETGIFHFLEHLLLLISIQKTYTMSTPSDIGRNYEAERTLSIPDYVATAGTDLSDWAGNERQRHAFSEMASLESALKSKNDSALTKQWRQLQSSDHFYYMSDRAYCQNCVSPYPHHKRRMIVT